MQLDLADEETAASNPRAVVALFITRWDVWVGGSVQQITDDAYARSDMTPLSAKIEGYVSRVPVNDFQQVKEGELLVEIEDDDYRARLEQAEAELAGAEAAIENLKSRKALQHSQIAEAQDAINATQADVDRTRKEAVRQQALLAYTFGTPQRVEQAVADEKRFEAGRSLVPLSTTSSEARGSPPMWPSTFSGSGIGADLRACP